MRNTVEGARAVLAAAEKPMDSYQLSRRVGCTPMEAGRALQELRSRGQAFPCSYGGDNALAEEFALASEN